MISSLGLVLSNKVRLKDGRTGVILYSESGMQIGENGNLYQETFHMVFLDGHPDIPVFKTYANKDLEYI